MKNIIAAIWLVVTGATVSAAYDKGQGTDVVMEPEAMLQTVKNFYRLSREVDHRGMEAVDEIMAMVHEDARYIHTEYAAEYDKAAWIDGYRRRIARAQTEREGETIITNHIAGKNILITERSDHWSDIKDGKRVFYERHGRVATYEFKDGKIWRIKEYWD